MRGEPTKIVSGYRVTPVKNQKVSRYSSLRRYVNTDGKSFIETPNPILIKESNRDTFYSVEKGYENRIDLISYKFYNTPFLWWAIASLNNIQNPMIIPAGLVLRIPSSSGLFSAGGVLSASREEM